jgi:hypothetical protein
MGKTVGPLTTLNVFTTCPTFLTYIKDKITNSLWLSYKKNTV